MSTTKLALALLFAVTAASNRPADACTTPASAAVHRYWSQTVPISGSPSNPDRCTYSVFSGWQCHLSGWLYTPTGYGNTNLPLITFIHGSGGDWGSGGARTKDAGCEWINYFVSRGYVVWSPSMRGVGDKTNGTSPSILTSTGPGFANTGVYVVDWTTDESQPSSPNYGWYTAAMPGWGITSPTTKDYVALTTLTYMSSELDDVQAALTYVTGLPGLAGTGKLVDPTQIALMGHSYGGLTVSLATSRALSPLPKVVVNLSGGALSWNSSDLWETIIDYYVTQHKQPVMSRQIKEESSAGFAPAETVYYAAAGTGPSGNRLSEFYADAALKAVCDPDPEKNQCYHTHFQSDATWVNQWAPKVLDFLQDNGIL